MRQLGLSATPFRADLSTRLKLWDREIYYYGISDAIREGVLVPLRIHQWDGGEATLDAAALEMIRRHRVLDLGPGVANASSILDAEGFAELCREAGIKTGLVHSRLPRGAGEKTMRALEAGMLQVVVHVSMLAEGVDFPWLRWGLFRRPVGSPVRLRQEMGRYIRTHPGKAEAVILDPLDLIGASGFASIEAMLGGALDDEEQTPMESELREAQEAEEKPEAERWAIQLAAWRRYLRGLYLAAAGRGLIDVKVKSTHWRTRDPSEKQLKAVVFLLGGLSRETSIPKPHRDMIRLLRENADRMTSGDVSDAIAVGGVIRDLRLSKTPIWDALFANQDTSGLRP